MPVHLPRHLTTAAVASVAAVALLLPVAAGTGPLGAPAAVPAMSTVSTVSTLPAGEHADEHGQFERTYETAEGTVTEVGHAVSVDPSVADAPAAAAVDAAPSARAGSERTYAPATRVDVRGSVLTKPRSGPRRPRPVQLAEKLGGRWAIVASGRSSRQGAVTFTVSSGTTEGVRTFRVQAPRFRTLRAVRSAPTTIRVQRATPSVPGPPPMATSPTDTPPNASVPTSGFDAPEPLPAGYRAAGSADAWEFLADGGGRWNPCRVIRWTYNPSAQGYEALADVKRAFAKISGVSGLKFAYVGPSSWRYAGSMGGFPSTQTDIAVGWASAQEYPTLAGSVIGVGGGQIRPTTAPDVKYQVVRGFLTLDNGHPGLPGGFGRVAWGQVMLHEILHALGLGHSHESAQLMYATGGPWNYQFAAGDITGMGKVGATQTCL